MMYVTSTLSSANFTKGNILPEERTQAMNNNIKLGLHILYIMLFIVWVRSFSKMLSYKKVFAAAKCPKMDILLDIFANTISDVETRRNLMKSRLKHLAHAA